MKRREFLQGSLLLGTAGVVLDACAPGSEQVIPILLPEERFVPGVEDWLRTTCFACPAHCGIEVRKIDGRLTKVEGNREHPLSRGGVCVRGQALPQAMYHPDRLRSPLRRKGERGSGEWEPISWDQAIGRLVEELKAASAEAEGGGIAFLTGELGGHRRALVERFCRALGSTEHWVHEPLNEWALERAQRVTTNMAIAPAVDIGGAAYLVSLGASLLEWKGVPSAGRLAELKRGRPGRRGKFVASDSRLSLTAANADEWLPVRPGTEASLALGLIHVLIRDQLYHRDFAARSQGFESFRAYASERVRLEDVADETGIAAETIERIAREMAREKPAVVVTGAPALQSSRGFELALLVSHLNALLGGLEPGGLVQASAHRLPFAPWPELAGPPIEARPLTERLSGPEPRVLLVADCDPLHSLSPAFGFAERLEEIPFIVSFASILDDTAARADLLLPESMSFERFEDSFHDALPFAALAKPLLVRPLYDTRSLPDVLIESARRIPGPLADAFPWTSYEAALQSSWSPMGWPSALERGGFWDSSGGNEEEIPYRFAMDGLESLEAGTAAPMEESRFHLQVYPSTAFGDGRSASLPFLQELADPITGVRWSSVVEINDQTATRLGIAAGERVEVRSFQGSLELPAYPTPGIRPDVVAIAIGQGHREGGRFAKERGVNAYQLLEGEANDAGPLLVGTTVSVRRLGA